MVIRMSGYAADISRLLLTFLLLIRDTPASGDECTHVKNVRERQGTSANLFCQIRNQPANPTFFKKAWGKEKGSSSTPVYTIYRDTAAPSIDIDGAQGSYKDRAIKVNDDTIRLDNIQPQDGGKYKCTWSVEPGIPGCVSPTEEFTLTVVVQVSNVKVKIKNSPVKEGETVTLQCSADGTPPISYFWMKVSASLPSGDRWQVRDDGTVTLSNVQRADAGKYRCQAKNEVNEELSQPEVLEVYYPPTSVELRSSPGHLSLREKTQVTLSCVAEGGHPAPVVSIYRNGQLLHSSQQTATKLIQLDRSDHQMAYVCQADSDALSEKMESNQIKFNVLYPPSVTVTPPSGAIKEGQSASFTCRASGGNPDDRFVYQWFLWSEFSSQAQMIGSKNQLVIDRATYVNFGNYTCRVTNQGGTASASGKLSVQFSAKLDPQVQQHRTVAADLGKTATIVLAVVANPAPTTVSWTRTEGGNKDSPLPQKCKVYDENENRRIQLVIPDLTQEDYTSYHCTVTNNIASEVFEFTVQSPVVTAKVGLIIGMVVLAFLIILAVVLVVLFIKRRRQKHSVPPTCPKASDPSLLTDDAVVVYTDKQDAVRTVPLLHSEAAGSADANDKIETAAVESNNNAGNAPRQGVTMVTGETAYTNASELKKNRDENAYQNMEELKQKSNDNVPADVPAEENKIHEKIVGVNGIVYENPKNFVFDESSQKEKKSGQQMPKNVEEPTEYAQLNFSEKPV